MKKLISILILLPLIALCGCTEDDPLADWVDTDEMNGPNDGLHYDKPGYAELGKQFAEKTIALLKKL